MRPYYLYIITIIILVTGCGNNETVRLTPGSELVFELPFEPTLIPIGYCDRGDTQNSFYYFADFRTSKRIAFCNGQGKVLEMTDLKPLIKDNAPWYTMQVRSVDSIAVISSRRNEVFLFSCKGRLLHQSDILPLKFNQTSYSPINGPSPPDMNLNICYSEIEPSYDDCRDSTLGKMDWNKWHTRLYNGPTFAQITNLFSDSPVFDLKFTGFRSRFMKAGTLSGSDVYLNSANSLYYTNTYADTFYQFDILKGQLVNQVPLKSDYSNMGAQSMSIGGNVEAQAHGDLVRSTKGVITEGKYDRYRKLIYLMFYHEVPANAKPIEKGEHRSWSMFIYNEQLEKLAEIPFKADTYLPKSLIVNPQGILLKKINKSQEEQTYKLTFQQFTISM